MKCPKKKKSEHFRNSSNKYPLVPLRINNIKERNQKYRTHFHYDAQVFNFPSKISSFQTWNTERVCGRLRRRNIPHFSGNTLVLMVCHGKETSIFMRKILSNLPIWGMFLVFWRWEISQFSRWANSKFYLKIYIYISFHLTTNTHDGDASVKVDFSKFFGCLHNRWNFVSCTCGFSPSPSFSHSPNLSLSLSSQKFLWNRTDLEILFAWHLWVFTSPHFHPYDNRIWFEPTAQDIFSVCGEWGGEMEGRRKKK